MPVEVRVGIEPEHCLLRRVLHRSDYLVWHDDFDRWVPSLAGIQFDPDGMSAFLRHQLEERDHGAEDVRSLGGTSDKPAVVYEFPASNVTDVGFSTHHSPNEDTPIGYAHASVVKPGALPRKEDRAARTALATTMNLLLGEIDLAKPDGA